jgi:P pilus assembly chaperone PapD
MIVQKPSNPLSRKAGRWVIISAFLFLLIPISELIAGVLVAPTVVFLSEQNRTGRMIVRNPTAEPKEIEIRMSFGLPISDSIGNVRVRLQDTLITDPRSAAAWVKPFPRRLTLAAGATQTIRFIANPPRDLPDGEYWARVVVRSQTGQTSLPVPGREGQITTNLNMIMQTAISLKYRTGDLVSRLEMENAWANQVDSQVQVTVDLINHGNVSYIGVLDCRLMDRKNREVTRNQIDLAVYYDLRRMIVLPLPEERGKPPYTVDILITNEGRSDIEPKDRIRGNEIKHSLALE